MEAHRRRHPQGLKAEADERTTTVILDSNFLFVPLRFGVDIFEEMGRLMGHFRCVVPAPVVEELRLLKQQAKPSLGKEIDFALSLAGRCETAQVHVRPGESVDDAIIRLSKVWGCPVATNDADLRRRLRDVGVPVIYLRQRAYLDIEGTI